MNISTNATFAAMHKLNSFQDFSFDLVCELIGDFKVRGKTLDPKTETPAKLFNRIDWIVNRVGRILDVSGKLDPEKTTFRVDRDENKIVHVRFIDLNGNTFYTLCFGNIVDKKFQPGFILTDANGNEVLRKEKWTDVRRFFAPVKVTTKAETADTTTTEEEEVVVAEAADPVA